MSRTDLISLLSVAIGAIAIVVSASIALIAVKIQRKQNELERDQAKKDIDKEVSEVARGLAHSVAQSFQLGAAPEAATVQAELMGLVVTATDLISGGIEGTWYLYQGLAMAHTWMWEEEKAGDNWRKALEKADSVRTRILLLTGKAIYHYTFGAKAAGRACFDEAESLIPAHDDVTRNQLAGVLADRAMQEYGVEELAESESAFARAWQQCKSIQMPWRREMASNYVAIRLLNTFGHAPDGLPDKLPGDLIQYAISMNTVAQQQGSYAAFPQQPTHAVDAGHR